MGKKIVIVGAGYSGILTAKKLAKKFKHVKDTSITIIDKNPFHTMLTELHEVAANRVDEESIKISLKKVFAGRKVDVKLDTVTSIDFDKKLVFGTAENYDYDYLVLCAGSKPTFFGTAGAEEFSYKLWSYDDAVRLKNHIHDMFRKAAVETDPEERKKLLTFYIVGAGFTGAEMAGELAEYVPILCSNFEIDRKEVTICNVDILSRTIPNLPEKLSDKVEKRMKKMGIRVMLNTGVVKIGQDFVETKFNDVITREGTYTVVWAAGIESADITAEAAKNLQSGGRGRIALDAHLRSLDHENVYVVGDNMLYTPEGEDKPVPQIVENCEHSAATAAHNIECAITGKGQMEKYKPSFHGFMVCIGGRYGVARVGLPNMMFNLPSWLAMFSKHLINMIYFVQVLGWNKVFSYMRHEFFTIRNYSKFRGSRYYEQDLQIHMFLQGVIIMKKTLVFSLICLMVVFLATGCGGNKGNDNNKPNEEAQKTSYYDGQYHAEYGRLDVRNWRPYIDITVKDGKITKAYYDYTNETGVKRSEDKAYIEGFSGANNGMTPRQAFDKLGTRLVETQDIQNVDAVSGATHSSRNFVELAAAALQKATDGDTNPATIPLYEDGTYRVEADAYDDHGWKPFVELTIAKDKITDVKFDYTNESGGLKTADAQYKASMEAKTGTYPEKYSKELAQQLIQKQVISQVDAVTGATTSSNNFRALVEYALDDMAEVGNKEPGIIKLQAE